MEILPGMHGKLSFHTFLYSKDIWKNGGLSLLGTIIILFLTLAHLRRGFVNFSHFLLLLQNHLASFNQTWQSILEWSWFKLISNEGPRPYLGENNNERVEIHLQNFQSLPFQNHKANFNQTWYKASWVNEIQVYSHEGYCPFPMMKITK